MEFLTRRRAIATAKVIAQYSDPFVAKVPVWHRRTKYGFTPHNVIWQKEVAK